MKIASWIFTAIAYALLIATVIALLVTGSTESMSGGETEFILIATAFTAVAFCLPGFIGHLLIDKYKKKYRYLGKYGLAVYILSFVPFIIPYIVLLVLALIVWVADLFIYLCTDRHYVLQFVVWVWSLVFDTGSSSSKPKEEEQAVFKVVENGLTRTLTFWGYASTTRNQNLQFTGYVPAYRDDVGNFWITTDGGQHFTAVNRGFDNDCSISKAD